LLDFFRHLFSTDFMPHVYCLREPGLVKVHLWSDGIIVLSYALIPLALVWLIRRRDDLAFPWMFSLFGVFILGCGLTHVMAVVTLWHPAYRLDGLIKAITAVASLLTAVLLFRLLPQVEALPSPAQMQSEIKRRQGAETELRNLNEQLEQRVAERTAALEQANRQVSESEARFRTLAEAVPNLLWTTDGIGSSTYLSPRYQQYTGKTNSDLVGKGWQRALHPEDRERVESVWRTAVQTGQPYETEYRLRRHDGTYRWFVARGVPICDDNGQIRQWLGSSTDIDDLKRTSAALRRSNEELQQFAYVAAHDLQEPLRNIANSVGFIKRFHLNNFDQTATKWVDFSVEGAQRMHDMIKDLLTYSRAVNGTPPPEEPVDANQAVQTALANLATAIAASGAKIEVGPLPPVRVLETHLVQIFQNLIANALKYRKENIRPEVRICASRNGAEVQFSVIDNGMGFDPQYSQRIFGVFKRLHHRNEYPGNGIGLAICTRITAHYGGRIWAESQTGQGAAFHFAFPTEHFALPTEQEPA
jgi:PAS domain S-box-containing protein